jgi:uncharacterized membrane protein/plastocyanin
MGAILLEWLGLAFRWLHVIAGICWIGNSFYFMWLDSHLTKPKSGDKDVEGELWLTHSGGFYQIERRKLQPDQIPQDLHWFKWESYMTWISGFFLLSVVYYMGGGVYLIDPAVSDISVNAAITLCISILFGSWFIYDALCHSPLAKNSKALGFIGYLALVGLAYFLSHTLSGRAAFLHVGAVMGTIMSGNVLMRIIPAQRKMIAALKQGKAHDTSHAKRAKQRSTHNNYMTLPVIFIMLSNHFPSTYGHQMNWLILAGLMLVGANVRHFFNVRNAIKAAKPTILIPAVVLFASLFYMVLPKSQEPIAVLPIGVATKVENPGSVSGQVSYRGEFKFKRPTIPSYCWIDGKEPQYDLPVAVRAGKLKNVFVWVSEGLEDFSAATPTQEILVDQRGCVYKPHVLGVQVGQAVRFLNSDTVPHNVRTVGKANPTFNELTPSKETSILKKFMRPETMINAKCDIHPWMGAYIGVIPHPFFAVTNESGEFTITGLPAGEYTLSAWHERRGKMSQKLIIKSKSQTTAKFDYSK